MWHLVASGNGEVLVRGARVPGAGPFAPPLSGAGGGIALFAGINRLYAAPGFLATVACALAPVPLAVLIFGKEVLA